MITTRFLISTFFLGVASVASGHMMRGGHGMGMMDEDHMMMGDGGMMEGGGMMMEDCPFAVQVDGKDVDDGECIESPPQGVSAKLVWKKDDDGEPSVTDTSRLLVWDTEAPCDTANHEVYVHFAGGQTAAEGDDTTTSPMTAGAGTEIHTYRAAWFDVLPVPVGTTGCHSLSPKKVQGCHHMKEWKVARHQSSCPEDDE